MNSAEFDECLFWSQRPIRMINPMTGIGEGLVTWVRGDNGEKMPLL